VFRAESAALFGRLLTVTSTSTTHRPFMIANSPRTIVPAPGGRWYDFRDHGDVALNADLPRLRSLLGATAVLWAGADGVTVEPRGWTALSGAKAVDYNVVVCHDASAGADLEAGVNRIAAAGVPAVMMVAGKALGEVQKLIELGWVCIGSVPLMLLELHPSDPAPATPVVRRLDGTQLDAARGIVDEVFGIGPELSLVAIPRDAADAWDRGADRLGDQLSRGVEAAQGVRQLAHLPGGRRERPGGAVGGPGGGRAGSSAGRGVPVRW